MMQKWLSLIVKVDRILCAMAFLVALPCYTFSGKCIGQCGNVSYIFRIPHDKQRSLYRNGNCTVYKQISNKLYTAQNLQRSLEGVKSFHSLEKYHSYRKTRIYTHQSKRSQLRREKKNGLSIGSNVLFQ